MCYILTTSPKAFIKVKEDEIIVTSDYSKYMYVAAYGCLPQPK